jgi:PPE-repeat protein
MNFQVLPPEVNSLLMFSGAGSGPPLRQGPPGTAWLPSGFGVDLVFVGDVGVGEPGMAGCRFSGNGGCGGSVFGMVECGGGIGVGGRRAGAVGGQRI